MSKKTAKEKRTRYPSPRQAAEQHRWFGKKKKKRKKKKRKKEKAANLNWCVCNLRSAFFPRNKRLGTITEYRIESVSKAIVATQNRSFTIPKKKKHGRKFLIVTPIIAVGKTIPRYRV